MRARTFGLCLLLGAVPACGGSHNPVPNPATATYVPWTGSIAFRSTRDGNAELYRANPDSANPMRLTSNAVPDEDPAWSHDGSKIAFVSTRDGNREIYIMNADSTGVTRLTNNPAADTHPAWSSDGRKIAFVSDRDGNDEIYVMDADGGNPTNLTKDANEDEWPSWAPAGDKIAFHSYRDSSWDIYVMNPDGTGQVALTYSRMWAAPPARAPRGIVFTATCPAWSRDGSRILFVTDEGGMSEVTRRFPHCVRRYQGWKSRDLRDERGWK